MAITEQRLGISFELTDEQKALRDLAHEFAEKEIRPREAEYDEQSTHPADVIAKAHEVGHALDQRQVEVVVDVILDGDREHALVDEAPHRLLDQALLFGEGEVHGRKSLATCPEQPARLLLTD